MLKFFNQQDYLGLFHSEINANLVNYKGELFDGDVIQSECGSITLVFNGKYSFRLFRNDPTAYVLAEDLKQSFKKL